MTRNYRTTPLPLKVALGNLERQMAEHLERQGMRLKQARKALKLSQEDAAHAIGVSSKTYGSWERGDAEPRDRNWKRIEAELQIKAEEIRGEPPESQLDRIEKKLDQLLGEMAAIRLEAKRPSRQSRTRPQSRPERAASGS